MVRKYKKKIGINFKNYDDKTLEKALGEVSSGRKTLRQAADLYKIPKSTLHDKIRDRKQGGHIVFLDSHEEERMLAEGITKFSEWGFPMTRRDRKPADASVTSKPEVQSVEPIPETSLQQPDGCLPEQTPSSSQTEDTRNCPTKRRNSFGRDYCRMCLEPIAARNQMVPLTLMDINFPTKSASFKQKKEVETYRITGMIQVVMPEFDFDAAYNPIVCHKCVIRLESAYNFITGCRENEAIIQLYKLKYCPDAELVFCEDVAHNKSVLVGRGSPRKKRKTSKEHISTESVSGSLPGQSGSQLEQSGSQLEQSGSQLEQSANTSDNDQTERFEVVYTSSAGQENLAPETSLELRSSIKCETEDYDGCDSDSHFMIPPEEVSCIVKEEVVVKEEVSCDFTDTSNNERVAQMDMNYQVKEEDCSQPDAPSISNMEDYHMHTSQYPATNQTSQIFNRPNT